MASAPRIPAWLLWQFAAWVLIGCMAGLLAGLAIEAAR